jgi:hypothetical protein
MRTAIVLAFSLGPIAVLACGESRRPIGEECIRNEDCLSDYCAARICVSAPQLVSGATGSPGAEEPRIPSSDASASIADAAGGS